MGWGRRADFRGTSGAALGPPRGYAPAPKSLPSSLTSPRKKTPGGDRPPAPRCVFGEEPRDWGSSRLRRGACSQRRHRAGAPWVGRGPPLCLRSTPAPNPGPSLQKSRDGAARVSTAAGQAPVRWEANPRKAGRSSPSSSPKRAGGKDRKPGARGKGEARGAGVWRDQDQDSRPGLKHFCSQTLGFQENAAAAGQPGKRSPLRFQSQGCGDVKNTRDVSCTLCIGSAGPREAGAAATPPPPAGARRCAAEGRAGPAGTGRGEGVKEGATRTPGGPQSPSSSPRPLPTFIAASPPPVRPRPGLGTGQQLQPRRPRACRALPSTWRRSPPRQPGRTNGRTDGRGLGPQAAGEGPGRGVCM
ncbi:collagen alpha-1(I) chain-like isoform X2 [Pipistrellus kuhlii]|uniref:collagen alpha-1(I) chain-like isoform X1 n=1 Tax=Pipistrellus kuhlii TaxID=59472 RepID=UPI001E26F2AB|nr:collagen alpha-1(I) chain-like isoform X1 [Pipistrellus kuhlii]XP_045430715.1 collagen alpha-1(I) chain-like isoform X2 [Pipistrellus kuhlii]